MRVTLITAADPFEETGGAERTLTTWLAHLTELGFSVDILTYGSGGDETVADCSVIRFNDKRPTSAIDSYVETTDVDVILTQSGWADIALWAADRHDVPSLLCVMGPLELMLTSGIAADAPPSRAISVSDDYRNRAEQVYDCEVTTVYQPIDFDYYTVENREPEANTLVNPVEVKGRAIFRELAQRRPHEQFLAKMGWMHQRNEDYSFDEDIQEIYNQTMRRDPSSASRQQCGSDQPQLDDIPNVEFVREGDIREIYRRTKVLLVPSQWEEAFGRVVIEAMHNGIPVIASNVGGLPEACGDAGMLVEDYKSVEAWADCLDEMQEETTYETFETRGMRRAAQYQKRQSAEIEKFGRIVSETADR